MYILPYLPHVELIYKTDIQAKTSKYTARLLFCVAYCKIAILYCIHVYFKITILYCSPSTGDLLNNYCVHDWAATVARFLYACVIMLTFPIEIFVCREVSWKR